MFDGSGGLLPFCLACKSLIKLQSFSNVFGSKWVARTVGDMYVKLFHFIGQFENCNFVEIGFVVLPASITQAPLLARRHKSIPIRARKLFRR